MGAHERHNKKEGDTSALEGSSDEYASAQSDDDGTSHLQVDITITGEVS